MSVGCKGRNINKLEREAQLYQALSKDYYSVYYIDFKKNIIEPIRMSKEIERDYGDFFRKNPSYEDAIFGYIENNVLEEEQADMKQVVSYENLKKQLKEQKIFMHDFYAIRDGKVFFCRMKVANLSKDGELSEAVMGFANVDSIKKKELERLAYIDNITGGYNYTHFYEQLKKETRDGFLVAIDIRAFKIVNDVCGMQKGDLVLRKVDEIVSRNIGKNDYLGHVNADHFIVFLEKRSVSEVEAILKNISDEVNKLSIKMDIPRVGAYFGVSDWNAGKRVTVALNEASKAKHNAKGKKDIIYAFYSKEDSEKSHEEKMMMAAFDKAIEDEKFEVWYQPKYSPITGEMTGAEALVRWRDSDGQLISPGRFIPLFEKNGLIRVLDEYVFRHVCKQQKYWVNTLGRTIPVSVNLSRSSLYFENVVQQYKSIVDEIGILPELVPIEITESITIDNRDIKELADEFYKAGFPLHIDDFGTGYSSLAMLNMIKFNTLKLDKSLIDYIGNYGGDQLLRHTVSLAKELGLHITAEGVENEDQVLFLKSLDCDNIQGFFYAKPMQADCFVEKLKDEKISAQYVYRKGQIITYSMIIDRFKACIGTSALHGNHGRIVVQINITGEGKGAFYILVDDYKIEVEPYEYYDRDALVTIESSVLMDVISGQKKLDDAYDAGQIKVEGDLKALDLLRKIINSNINRES